MRVAQPSYLCQRETGDPREAVPDRLISPLPFQRVHSNKNDVAVALAELGAGNAVADYESFG